MAAPWEPEKLHKLQTLWLCCKQLAELAVSILSPVVFWGRGDVWVSILQHVSGRESDVLQLVGDSPRCDQQAFGSLTIWVGLVPRSDSELTEPWSLGASEQRAGLPAAHPAERRPGRRRRRLSLPGADAAPAPKTDVEKGGYCLSRKVSVSF